MKVGGERILVIDAGTTGTRAAVFDLSGRLLGVAYREYKSRFLSPSRSTRIRQLGSTRSRRRFPK